MNKAQETDLLVSPRRPVSSSVHWGRIYSDSIASSGLHQQIYRAEALMHLETRYTYRAWAFQHLETLHDTHQIYSDKEEDF